jgi:superfamily I DNA/RNA helicase
LLKERIQFKNVVTFHALGYQILKNAGLEVKLVSERQQQRILTELKSSLGLTKNYSRKDLELLISKTKNSGADDPQGILTAYNNKLHQSGLQDYEDLIIDATRLYRENKQLQRYTYILIDEFQDTSRIQLELISALSAGQIFAVGDPRQAIYDFRGSDPESFNNLRTTFPGQEFTTIELTENYRSAPELVAAANLIFPEFQPLQAQVQLTGAWHRSRLHHCRYHHQIGRYLSGEFRGHSGSLHRYKGCRVQGFCRTLPFALSKADPRTKAG